MRKHAETATIVIPIRKPAAKMTVQYSLIRLNYREFIDRSVPLQYVVYLVS